MNALNQSVTYSCTRQSLDEREYWKKILSRALRLTTPLLHIFIPENTCLLLSK